MYARAGSAKANGKIALSVHRRTSHPAPGRVRLVSALLIHSHWAGRHIAQFKPTHTSHSTRAYGVVANDGFVVAEVSISEAEHQTISDAIEIICAGHSILWHTSPAARTKRGETGRGWISKGGERRARRSNKIHMEVIGGIIWITGLPGKSYKSVGSPCRRQPRSVDVCGQKGIDRVAKRSDRTNKCRGLPGQHFCPIKGEWLRTEVTCTCRVKDVHAHIIGIGPYAKVRVIKEIRAEVKPVTVIAASGI